ncbi:MAG: FHA domain-containing protein [Myxococcota bacterium]
MVVGPPDPSQLIHQVPSWIGALRAEANRALGDLEIGVRRTTDDLANAIASKSNIDELASLEVLLAESAAYRAALAPVVSEVGARLALALATELSAVATLAEASDGEHRERLLAAYLAWDTTIRRDVERIVAYVCGFVDGGGLALALLTELPPDVAGHTGEVAAVLSERVAFVPQQVDEAVMAWIAQVHREVDELLLAMSPPPPPPPDPKLARLAALLERAAELGVTVKPPPAAPTDRYLDQLEGQLTAVARKRATPPGDSVQRGARLAALTKLARALGVSIRQAPEGPSERWLDRLEKQLRRLAEEKGVAVPQELDGTVVEKRQPPSPLEPDTETLPAAPRADEVQAVRIKTLRERAAEAGLDLGRIPAAPTAEWIAETEKKLVRAIAKIRLDRQQEQATGDAERKQRIARLQDQAQRLGRTLSVPAYPTDDWIERAELRLTSQVLTPVSKAAGTDLVRGARMRQLLSSAAAVGVDLGEIPGDPDAAWFERAQRQVDLGRLPAPEPPTVPTTRTAELVYEAGTIQEQRWGLVDGAITVGRARDNQVHIRNDGGVSRKHCSIRLEKGRYVLRDEGSTQGTVVDGVKVRQLALGGGEQILVGDTRLVFRLV